MKPRATLAAFIAALAFLLCAGPSAARAQTPDSGPVDESATLATIVAHIDAARFDSARSVLATWQSTRAPLAREIDRTQADLLRARLERDGVAAQHAWLALALAHPFGSVAGLALLRVGQAAVLQGDTAAAVVYLRRLIDDFSGGGSEAEARLWLSRAHFAAGRSADACTAARTGLTVGASDEVEGLLRLQEQRACAAAALTASPRAPDPAGSADTPADAARFAVQSGAFRTRSSADALMARLRRAGLEPRIVTVPANDLMRVRVGAFTAQSEAIRLRDRLRGDGFDAVVVTDAAGETPVP